MTDLNKLTPEELDALGAELATRAQNSLKKLGTIELEILWLWHTWKDGADWDILLDLGETLNDEDAKSQLITIYGYSEK